ncbi:transposase [Myxococcus sp. AM010]|uniref:IS66 family transposase n=1 Tax=Myxococcus sp. AM010 TaxID=2745138 RepID=UPI0020D0524D|nr:transposase [Myxococcus sp. AM010]
MTRERIKPSASLPALPGWGAGRGRGARGQRESNPNRASCRDSAPGGDALPQQLRHERSRQVVEKLHTWACEARVLPESALGKAVAFMRGLWPGLTHVLRDERIPLDTNAVERAPWGVFLGRKNHYGSRSRSGTEVAALFYSLLESAKRCGVEPKAYLRSATLAAMGRQAVPRPHIILDVPVSTSPTP